MKLASKLAQLPIGGATVSIEYAWVGHAQPDSPVLVFLHEGLGSLVMWKDFPHQLCLAAGLRGLVYSRPGYGQSTPRAAQDKWPVDFMHTQARVVLPALLESLGVKTPVLFGHSDGGSIALIYAASFPQQVAGIVVMAPHIFVEDVSVQSIAKTKQVYETTDLKSKLARYHSDVDSAFWGWNDIWLNPAFRSWNIQALLPQITCPVLAIQGRDDEYGTLAQIEGIAAAVPQTRLAVLEACGHSPHRDQTAAVIRETTQFLQKL
ncbi:MAG: alpha/beta fold hydrolase [Burkholderiaceae bacterium]